MKGENMNVRNEEQDTWTCEDQADYPFTNNCKQNCCRSVGLIESWIISMRYVYRDTCLFLVMMEDIFGEKCDKRR